MITESFMITVRRKALEIQLTALVNSCDESSGTICWGQAQMGGKQKARRSGLGGRGRSSNWIEQLRRTRRLWVRVPPAPQCWGETVNADSPLFFHIRSLLLSRGLCPRQLVL